MTSRPAGGRHGRGSYCERAVQQRAFGQSTPPLTLLPSLCRMESGGFEPSPPYPHGMNHAGQEGTADILSDGAASGHRHCSAFTTTGIRAGVNPYALPVAEFAVLNYVPLHGLGVFGTISAQSAPASSRTWPAQFV